MKLETIITPSKEIFVAGEDVTATVNTWSNCEGINLMLTGKNLDLRMCGALRWEDIDVLLIALTAARAA